MTFADDSTVFIIDDDEAVQGSIKVLLFPGDPDRRELRV